MVDEFPKQCWTPTDQAGAGSVLIVEDDKRLMQCLARAMEARGFKVMIAGSVCRWLSSNSAECTGICCGRHAVR